MQQQTSLLFALVITREDDECGELTTISDYTCDNNVCNHESSGCGDVTCINGGFIGSRNRCVYLSQFIVTRGQRTSKVERVWTGQLGYRAVKTVEMGEGL